MLSIILCCAGIFAVSTAFPGGPPSQACGNLRPGAPHGTVEQGTPNPWMVDVSGFDVNGTYTPGQTYTSKFFSCSW